MINIFEFTNYRDYLKAFYEEKKRESGYTYREFSRAAGMNSSSWLMHLINGQKNLSPESTMKAARALGMVSKELEYFQLMVQFTQSRTTDTRNHFFQRIVALKKKVKQVTIKEEQYEYYSKWYHPVLRSLVSKIDFQNDYALLGRSVLPAISASDAKNSVELLKRLGFIRQTESGKWEQTENIISTGDEVASLNLVNYHKEVAHLAADAHDRMPPELRDISSMTLGINQKDFIRIRDRVREFRKEILQIVNESENEDRVCQLNFQFFHASHTGGAE